MNNRTFYKQQTKKLHLVLFKQLLLVLVIFMTNSFIGEISESYQKQWKPHIVRPDEKEPDIYDVIEARWEICYRLDMRAAQECFSDCIQVDWGGWAYKVTKEQILKYNQEACHQYLIPEDVAETLNPAKQYAIIDRVYSTMD